MALDPKRMTCRIVVTDKQVKVTCSPLFPDVTKEELYETETELCKAFVTALAAMGCDCNPDDVKPVRDHEEDGEPHA